MRLLQVLCAAALLLAQTALGADETYLSATFNSTSSADLTFSGSINATHFTWALNGTARGLTAVRLSSWSGSVPPPGLVPKAQWRGAYSEVLTLVQLAPPTTLRAVFQGSTSALNIADLRSNLKAGALSIRVEAELSSGPWSDFAPIQEVPGPLALASLELPSCSAAASSNNGGSTGGSSAGASTGSAAAPVPAPVPLPVPAPGSASSQLPAGPAPFQVPAGYVPLWWDEFDGTAIDASKWSFDTGNGGPELPGWGNEELQYYTDSPSNVKVSNGVLTISARREPKDGSAYTSARLSTKGKAGFFPRMKGPDGRAMQDIHIETRIKLPAPGNGLWPAFWANPVTLNYGPWAASGEVDFVEGRNDMRMLTQGVHFGGPWPDNRMTHGNELPPAGQPNWSAEWHTFSADWSADAIQFSMDGQAKVLFRSRALDPEKGWYTTSPGASACAPFCDQPYYLILNLAVGGRFPGVPPDAATPFPADLQVDYIRVWGRPAP